MASYVENVLGKGEEVLYRAHVSWWGYFWTSAFGALILQASTMKKILATLAITTAALCAPDLALAQNTAQANLFRRDTCEAVAFRGANAWQYRMAKEPYPFHTISTSTSSLMHMWAVHFAMNDAGSQESAFKVPYAMCMDNVDAVYRASRNGRTMTEAELR